MPIPFIIGVVLGLIFYGLKNKKSKVGTGSMSADEKKKQEITEHITVILPTINNDGK